MSSESWTPKRNQVYKPTQAQLEDNFLRHARCREEIKRKYNRQEDLKKNG
jgi:hypothetical protein